jgi:UDP-galactopyranose mutase
MLHNPNIDLRLNTDFFSLFNFSDEGEIFHGDSEFLGKLIYTGEIDHFFNYKYGELPYRSLEFIFENHSIDSYQSVAVVNYPNEFDFTRITEFKKMTGQNVESTTINKEYPKVFKRGSEMIPYYPIPKDEFKGLYSKYEAESKKLDRSFFIGRLAEYKYYDMDQIVANAINLANELIT